jgi:arginine N-succinyltransferase
LRWPHPREARVCGYLLIALAAPARSAGVRLLLWSREVRSELLRSSTMFLIRDVAPKDLDDLQRAAVHLDSVNLPNDREALAAIIERSQRSFASALGGGAGDLPVADRCFVFVAADAATGEVVGTSMIFAQHGSRRAPHVFFDVLEEERYSETLDRHFAHRVLRIGYNYKGLTEIGGLVVRPELRRHPEKLGRMLASVRFLYLARHRGQFRDEVLSELMPPLEPDGTSLLWESLGRKFTGLSYQEADRLSQNNKEFIRALFPQDPLYVTLLPAHVQELIGTVGPETRGVEKMLREVGFAYAHRIDPFDGGPHFQARTDDITLVQGTRRARVAAGPPPAGPMQSLLVARERTAPPYFLATRAAAVLPARGTPAVLALPVETCRVLDVGPGDEIAHLALA